ncbi:MAG: pilus assembly protein, partial [Paracoccaceae bacterium]|nr:pilus assembly protein [Paracoccaceae bacterium]
QGDLTNPTVAEIWANVRPLLPVSAQPSNLYFTYRKIDELGFLGGPFTPLVTVELKNQTFEFVSPLSEFAAMAGATSAGDFDADFVMPTLTVTLPGEDLAQGTSG